MIFNFFEIIKVTLYNYENYKITPVLICLVSLKHFMIYAIKIIHVNQYKKSFNYAFFIFKIQISKYRLQIRTMNILFISI
jgi:hypothetical protein